MLKPGEVIDNATLSRVFGVANSGGMRRSLALYHLVVIADWTRTTGVKNRWQGDVLHFAGQGAGDQVMTKQNRTLARSPITGETVHLLEVMEPGRYVYRGRVALAGEPYQEKQPDAQGHPRDVWMFPLRLRAADEVDLRHQYGHRPPAPPIYLPAGAYAVISAGIPPERLPEVNGVLDKLKAVGVDVVDQRDVDHARYEEAIARWHARQEDALRARVRRLVREQRAKRKAAGQPWSFASDEVDVAADANEDRVREVLELIGFADQFKRLRDEAYSSVEQPDPPEGYVDPGPMSDEEFEHLQAQIAARAKKPRVIGRP